MALLAVTGLWYFWKYQAPIPFDQEEFLKDTERSKAEYFDQQALLQSIAHALLQNEDILYVTLSSDRSAKLRTRDEEMKAFADYQQLYSDVGALLDTGFEWRCFSKYSGQESIVECLISVENYGGGVWTEFYYYFCTDEPSELGSVDCCEQLSENCWFVVKKLQME